MKNCVLALALLCVAADSFGACVSPKFFEAQAKKKFKEERCAVLVGPKRESLFVLLCARKNAQGKASWTLARRWQQEATGNVCMATVASGGDFEFAKELVELGI